MEPHLTTILGRASVLKKRLTETQDVASVGAILDAVNELVRLASTLGEPGAAPAVETVHRGSDKAAA